MIPPPRPLSEVLAERPDFRHPRGQRPPVAALLARAWSARLCGSRRYPAIAAWGRQYGAPLGRAGGFPIGANLLRHGLVDLHLFPRNGIAV